MEKHTCGEIKLKKVFNVDRDMNYDILICIILKALEVGGMFINLKFGNDFSSVYTHAE